MPGWTFITNHGAVLALVAEHGRIPARDIANRLGITERSVHRVLTDLEESGYIARQRVGRTNEYQVNRSVPLRRPESRTVMVGDLLKVIQQQSETKRG